MRRLIKFRLGFFGVHPFPVKGQVARNAFVNRRAFGAPDGRALFFNIEIDQIERQVMQLEMERQALEKESDPASAARLAKVVEEMANMTDASRTYQTNIELVSTAKRLMLATLRLGQ